MKEVYYLCFSINKIPDLTLKKYSVFDGSSVDNIMDKHGIFLRQLHRLGHTSGVYFHLLYYYNPDKSIPKGHHLSVIFYVTSQEKGKLENIREFLITSVLSNYYEFFCYEIAREFSIEEESLADGSKVSVLKLTNISGEEKIYSLGNIDKQEVICAQREVQFGKKSHIVCEIASDSDVVLSFDRMPVDDYGKIILNKRFTYGAFLTKKDYSLPAQNRLNDTDDLGEVQLYSIMEWEPCEAGRLYNVLKLMEGYNRNAVLRIDIFPVEHTQEIRKKLPYSEVRRRISSREQGKDDNSENIVKSWDKYLNNLMKFPQFFANVVAFADAEDVAVMLADSVAAEAVESGTYLIETMSSQEGFAMYESDMKILRKNKEINNYVAPYLSLYTLEEIRPMFSLPILYQGESIECLKETDPIPFENDITVNEETGEVHEVISLGTSSMGYDVTFPIKLLKKHAFIAGVPGAGKTNTMLYLVTTLWRDTKQHIPFLVLEPAKQEYRALTMIEGMEGLCVFSPGADTKFPLHINPFQFPVGLTLAEHIANLNAVFAGAFELIPPSPFLIDSCIEKIYLDKGWNINERNNGKKEYPTMQELYDSLRVAVEESGYEGESKANIRSVMEVRIGSLLRREIGNVYNVSRSSMDPEEWLKYPVIIELEALGEGPANFMSLLISTLIREVLKIKKTSDNIDSKIKSYKSEIEHIIFYEEAHNLIGPTTDDPVGGSVDPKISATKYLVKMLAEVRALGEGIVIADQLPTAMAPEVLKNTGLKLGHRITAQDDRNLLGGTMSASAEQLEEQGTFGTGQALIFYENLLKPFKMQVCEWEKGVSQKKYDSPTDLQMFERLKDNKTYKELIKRSSIIMQEKMKNDFGVLHREIEKLRHQISKNTNSSNGIIRDLKKICWNFENQYFAYMTLSKNYNMFTNDMYICTIKNYLSLFSTLGSLVGRQNLIDIIISETSKVMNDMSVYVDILNENCEAVLIGHTEYNNLIFAAGEYISHLIYYESNRLLEKTNYIIGIDYELESQVASFAKEFSDLYFKYIKVAEKYFDIACLLADSVKKRINNAEIEENDLINKSIIQYESEKLLVYKALYSFVIKIFKRISCISGIKRKVFLTNTKEVLTSFRSIVDYRDINTNAILSSWDRYFQMWEATNEIAIMEMAAKFDYLHNIRLELLEKIYNENNAENFRLEIRNLCIMYNSTYQTYARVGCETSDYRRCLVNNYCRYLESMLKYGEVTSKIIADTSSGNWADCHKNIMMLYDDDNVDKEKKIELNRLSVRMSSIMKC